MGLVFRQVAWLQRTYFINFMLCLRPYVSAFNSQQPIVNFVKGLLSWFFYDLLLDFENSLTALLYFTLPGILYTLILTPPIYLAVYAVARLLRNRE